MGRYLRKPLKVYAFPVWFDNIHIEKIKLELQDQCNITDTYVRLEVYQGPTTAREGDWIIRDDIGYYVLQDNEFRATFTKILD